ncbi:uncharacterized protein LOC129564343 [Moschus berezovskii]|uniref:uncharacterized protein LOC129564343 n=1 Tax=Moschus berezovskii TaxID=68408 RepID=UPI00244431C4|nr:uncharacterized protein LOC129564343 [Moschus berezovskii]
MPTAELAQKLGNVLKFLLKCLWLVEGAGESEGRRNIPACGTANVEWQIGDLFLCRGDSSVSRRQNSLWFRWTVENWCRILGHRTLLPLLDGIPDSMDVSLTLDGIPDSMDVRALPLRTRVSCVFQSSWRAWQANSTGHSVPERLYICMAEAKAETCSSSQMCLFTGSLASSDTAIGSMKGRMWTLVSHQYVRPCSHRYLSVAVPSSRWIFPRMICISSSWNSPSRPAVASPARVVPLGFSWVRGHCQAQNRPSLPTPRLRRPPRTGTPPPPHLSNCKRNSRTLL